MMTRGAFIRTTFLSGAAVTLLGCRGRDRVQQPVRRVSFRAEDLESLGRFTRRDYGFEIQSISEGNIIDASNHSRRGFRFDIRQQQQRCYLESGDRQENALAFITLNRHRGRVFSRCAEVSSISEMPGDGRRIFKYEFSYDAHLNRNMRHERQPGSICPVVVENDGRIEFEIAIRGTKNQPIQLVKINLPREVVNSE